MYRNYIKRSIDVAIVIVILLIILPVLLGVIFCSILQIKVQECFSFKNVQERMERYSKLLSLKR